jgi:hypothetical protein
MRHRRIDEIPGSIIGAAHKPPAVVVEEGNVTIAVATKDHSLIGWSRSDWSRDPGDAHPVFTPL